jgi:glycosyltransferase involved in cell wall biosynthesis
MTEIKVAHITTIDLALRILLLHQMRSLKEAGYEVAGISTAGPYVPDLEAAGIRHINVPMTRNITPLADLVSLWRLYRVLRKERFTIVHTHNPKPGLLGQLAARLAGVPIVVNTVHGFYFNDYMAPANRRFYIFIEKLAALCSDLILSQNDEDRQTALREGICTPRKIQLLGNGIDLTEFNPDRFSVEEVQQKKQACGLPLDAQVVGFVGRMAARRKGFLDFLKAGQILAGQNQKVWFLVAGETDEGKPDAVTRAAAADYGIADRCVFLGNLPPEELPLIYKLINVLVLPSLFEGVPRVVMEASAMGVPAVASDVKGNREAVVAGRNGLLVPYGAPTALAAAIMKILTDPEKARQMGEEGRLIALERFNELKVFEKVQAAYAQLLQEKGLESMQPTLLY